MAITWERDLSPFLTNFFAEKASLNERAYNSHYALTITLDDLTELHYATGTITIDSLSKAGASVSITPINFIARVSTAADIQTTNTGAPDVGDFQFFNLDYFLSQTIADADRIFDNAKVTVYWAFPKPDGNYEALIYFNGLVSDLKGDDENFTLAIIADISSRTALVGKEITQRCVNELGDQWCGVGLLPVGAVCSKVWRDAEGGCEYWGGVFNGIPPMNPDASVTGAGTWWGGGFPIGGGGGGDDPSPFPIDCPDEATSIFPSANGGIIKGKDLRNGEVILNHKNEPVMVENCERIWAKYRYYVETIYNANLIVSATHHFLTGVDDERGKAACNWKDGLPLVVKTPLGICLAHQTRQAENFFFPVASEGYVLRIAVTDPHTYMAGMQEGLYLANHNRKADFPLILV